MKFMTTFKFRDGAHSAAAKKFLEGGAPPPAGAEILGRWHASDGSGGFSLLETDDPAVAYEHALTWSEHLEIHTVPVLEDQQVGPILAKVYGS